MLDLMFIILIIFAVLTMIIAYEYSDAVFAIMSSVAWFVAALGALRIEIPFEIYNASSGNIETGTHVFENLWQFSYLFMGFAVVTFIGFMTYTLATLYEKKRR